MSLTDVPFGLAVSNAASGDSILRTGVAASLTIAVANNTGADIAPASGVNAAAFGVYLPSPALFTLDQLRAITVTADGWAASLDAPNLAINITSIKTGTWASGQTLTFTLTNVTSSGPPGSGTVTLLPSNLGDAPLSIEASLSVANPPAPTNLTLLGPAGTAQATATFSFSNLISLTPAGRTQMLVLCTGFAKDAHSRYDDHLFVLDIVKLDPPPTRGLLSFFGLDPVTPISSPNSQITIPLRWTMCNVAAVRLLSSSPSVAVQRKSYPVPPRPVDYDNTTMTLPAPTASEAIFFTLQAYDVGGG